MSKEPKEEIANEVHTVATNNALREIRGFYDPIAKTITNEVTLGLCSTCGKPLTEGNVAKCYLGCIICNSEKCMNIYEGRAICRTHVEVNIGTKEEAVVLIAIGYRKKKHEVKKLSELSERTVERAKEMLVSRGYIEIRSVGLFGCGAKITEIGFKNALILLSVYDRDPDFQIFLARLGVDKSGMETGAEQK